MSTNELSPDLMSPDGILRLAQANLAQRAQKGERLTPDEWARLDAMTSKPAEDPLADLLESIQQQIEAVRASGGKPPAAALKIARQALLRDLSAHVWPDAAAASGDLHVSVATVRNWCDELGIAHQRTAISKADLYRALWQRAETRQTQLAIPGTEADQREQALRIAERQARLDARTGRLQAEAADAARAEVIRLAGDLRQALTNRLPAILADSLAGSVDRLAWESDARRIIHTHLTQLRADLERVQPPSKETAATAATTAETIGTPTTEGPER